MTTPERLRRRQLIESAMLIVVGIGMILQAAYFHGEDQHQRDCIEDNFAALSYALEARADTTDRETAAIKNIWLVYAEAAGLVKDDPTEDLKPEDQARFRRALVAELLQYQRIITQIEAERKANPLPPYPPGQCTT